MATTAKLFGAEAQALFKANEACYCNLCILDQIGQIADALRTAPQRKVLLFVGSALTLDVRDADPLGSSVDSVVSPMCGPLLKKARTAMLASLERSSVTIHSLDPSGLAPLPGTNAASSMRSPQISEYLPKVAQTSLVEHGQIRVLPDFTGGRVVTNTNDPQRFVPAVLAESSVYYLLGFDAPLAPARVEVRSTRRGINVRTQKTFDPNPPPVAMPIAEAARQQTAAVQAVTDALPKRDLPMSTAALPLVLPGSLEPGVIVVAGFDAAYRANASTARVEIVVSALDPRARPITDDRFVVALGRPTSQGLSAHYDVAAPLVLKPGQYEIRIGAAEADGPSGSSVSYVEVPDYGRERLALSGIAVTTIPQGASVAIDGAEATLPFLPTTRRSFQRDETLRAVVRIYEGQSDPVAPVKLGVLIVDAKGAAVVTRAETIPVDRFDASRTAAYGMDIPLSTLAPGEYLLSLIASGEKDQARRDVRFTVR